MSTRTIPGVADSVARLKALAGKGRLSAEEIDRKADAYFDELLVVSADPSDVAAGVDLWLAMQPDAFPDSWALFRSAVEEARFKRVAAEAQTSLVVGSGPPARPGENFVQRSLRLGVHAGRLSVISYGRYEPLARLHAEGLICDADLHTALRWLEDHPGERLARAEVDRLSGRPADSVESARGVWSDCKRIALDPASVGGVAAAKVLWEMGLARLRKAVDEGRMPGDAIGKLPRPPWVPAPEVGAVP